MRQLCILNAIFTGYIHLEIIINNHILLHEY